MFYLHFVETHQVLFQACQYGCFSTQFSKVAKVQVLICSLHRSPHDPCRMMTDLCMTARVRTAYDGRGDTSKRSASIALLVANRQATIKTLSFSLLFQTRFGFLGRFLFDNVSRAMQNILMYCRQQKKI